MTDLTPYTPEKTECFERLQSLWSDRCALEREAEDCAGGVQWKTVKDREYLIHNYLDPVTGKRRFDSKGVRSPKTEAWRDEFLQRRAAHDAASARLDERLRAATGAAKAIKLGRVPVAVGEMFRTVALSSLSDRLVLSGSIALAAYETLAHASFPPDAFTLTDTRSDVDVFVRCEDDLEAIEPVLLSMDREIQRGGREGHKFVGKNVVVDCFTRSDLAEIAEDSYGSLAYAFLDATEAEPIDAFVVDRSGMIAPVRVLPPEKFAEIKALRFEHDPLRGDELRRIDVRHAGAGRTIAERLGRLSQGFDHADDEFGAFGRP